MCHCSVATGEYKLGSIVLIEVVIKCLHVSVSSCF